jgi:thiol-disulfide isomerase/thioredoxin
MLIKLLLLKKSLETLMRKAALFVLVFLFFSTNVTAQNPRKASDILKTAQSKAADQNKSIFLIFGASWCEPCHQLDTFLALPDIAPIIEQYFVVARITFGEAAAGHPDWDTPGSDTLLAKYGGITSAGKIGLPFIALLDPKAKLIANSNAPASSKGKSETTGFPTEPDEIRWFLSMLEKAAPALSPDDLHKIETCLRQAAAD